MRQYGDPAWLGHRQAQIRQHTLRHSYKQAVGYLATCGADGSDASGTTQHPSQVGDHEYMSERVQSQDTREIGRQLEGAAVPSHNNSVIRARCQRLEAADRPKKAFLTPP